MARSTFGSAHTEQRAMSVIALQDTADLTCRRPTEVRPGVAKAMAKLAVAEAQAVFAHR